MDEHFIKIHKWLYPVSWIYGAVVVMRNKLFDWGIFRSKSFDVPVICVGKWSLPLKAECVIWIFVALNI